MVAFKYMLLAVASLTSSVLAQDPTGDDAAAQAFWDQASNPSTQLQGGDAAAERRAFVHDVRNDDGAVLKDPYKGSYCWAPYTAPPCETKCNRNNCFRGFLNGRDGSDGNHCPKEAFGFCCVWNFANDFEKWWALKHGVLDHFAPYALNCKSDGDKWTDVVAKINDVCGCTLNHEVTVDVTSAYYGLRSYWPQNAQCH